MTIAISVGTRFPAYATSMGRVPLAGLDNAELAANLAPTPCEHLTRHTLTDDGVLRGGWLIYEAVVRRWWIRSSSSGCAR